ncbi:hypothetical protein ACFWVM_33630 [Nocardia fluminea]|uniref:hypothetical protein n=1 Tax=Nocardia fluminea TaxID=134984 RepID=UPI00364C8735
MTILEIVLTCVGVALFAALCGVTSGALHKKSNPADPAGAVSHGLKTTGTVIMGAFGVIAVIVVLANQPKLQPATSPPTTQIATTTLSPPTGVPAGAR